MFVQQIQTENTVGLVMVKVSYQLFSPENSHVNILQRAVIILIHLGRPQGAVYMGPLILPDVQQPPPLLKQADMLHVAQRHF